jgi:hypothetical protein
MRRETGMQRRSFLKSAGIFAALGAPNLLAKEKDRPDLTLGVISDTHIGTHASAVTLERTLKFFRDRKVDVVMICGDLADWGLLSGLKYIAETWEKVFPHGKGAGGKKVQKLFCTGNHDFDGYWYGDMTMEMHANGYSERESLKRRGMAGEWERAFGEKYAPIRTRTVKGYDFVSAEWDSFDKFPEWMAENGSRFHGEKPFFFFQHPPVRGTTSDSGGWDDKGAAFAHVLNREDGDGTLRENVGRQLADRQRESMATTLADDWLEANYAAMDPVVPNEEVDIEEVEAVEE